MKKLALFVTIVSISLNILGQETEKKYPQDLNKKYELKLNAFNLIVFNSLDVSFEKLINKDLSFGVSLFYNFTDIVNADVYINRKFSLTPYYRWFFNESRFARGFFVEGFGMLNTQHDYFYNTNNSSSVEYQTGFALGISLGGKFVTKNGFTTEVLLGVGRNLISEKNRDDFIDTNIIGRFSISLGYRF